MVVLKLVSNTRSVAAVRPRVATWPKNRGMVMRWIYCVLVLLGVVTGNGHAAGDNDLSYDEELYFRQLNKDHVLSVFNFALELTTGDDGKSALNHGNGFPRPYANLALSNKVQELDLSITAGRWQTPKWGSPEPRLHFPYGARVSAKFAERDLEGTLESTWSGLISELAGLFCASLSEMRLEEALVSRKRGADGSNFVVVESVLSRERVCTENLTPFTKLMPCRNKAGLGQLANPRTLFGGPYHGISVQVRRHSSQDDEPGTKFIVDQTVAAVLFAEDSNPNSESTQREVALAPLLGMTEEFRSCPVATSSTLIRHHSWGDSNSHGSLVEETPMASVHTNTLRASRSSHDIRQNLVHNLQLHRFASPRSKERGTISTRVLNADPSQSVVINYREQFPWNIKVYMHTCKVLLNGEAVDLTVNSSSVSLISGGDGSQSGWPFVSKGRAPAVVQLTNVSLRPGGTLFFSIEYEARFLNVDDFPPDPNYGFDMPPAEVEVCCGYFLVGASCVCERALYVRGACGLLFLTFAVLTL